MGNCFSDVHRRRPAIGGNSAAHSTHAGGPSHSVNSYRGLFSQIELSLSASNLRDLGALSESNPVAVINVKGSDGTLQELGRTEVVPKSQNPQWTTKHIISYYFEVVQTLVFHLYNVDEQFQDLEVKMLKLDELQLLGEATCVLSEIITKSSRSLTIDLMCIEDSIRTNHRGKSGHLTICAEECANSKITTELVLRCLDLECEDLFGRTDPFVVISKCLDNGAPLPICKTEVLNNDLTPVWEPVFLNIQQVGSKETSLLIECFNYNSNGRHDLIGKAERSIADIEKLHCAGEGVQLYFPNNVGNNHQNEVLKSQLYVDKISESVQPTFLDYIAGGWELNFMVAIDFTASNGNPRLPDSLHYIDPSGRHNAYQKTISDVGEVLQFYDSVKRFPAWGFGARPIDGPVSHCFNLNGSSNYCEVEGIQGILKSYTSALFNVSLAGPTLFGPVITAASLIASQSLENTQHKYYVLLIITDGVITDLQETKEVLVKASDLPLSILIVGVGGADYKEMEIFDADKGGRIESPTGLVASRDMVHFFPFRNVKSGELSLVQLLLADLPSQFLTYMRTKSNLPFS
ncbi:protein BONZAI 1-like isoform X2 [Apium graveolens]|uniref:protein BONZAI 1-like isoform X2 n=1 Tax=Apium graveolens TaxID=4045 RepID=UPI003D7B116A